MSFLDLLFETYISLSANKVRSALTILGIVIGIASVIAMVSIGEGAQRNIQGSIEGLGSNILTILPGAVRNPSGISTGRGSARTLRLNDAEILAKIAGVVAVSPEVRGPFQVSTFKGQNTNVQVVGVVPEYQSIRNLTLKEGSFLNKNQLDSAQKVAVLGSNVAADLFQENSAFSQTIRINRVAFNVIGVLETKGGLGFGSVDDMIFIPLTTMQRQLVKNDYLSMINVQVENKEMTLSVEEQALNLLSASHRVSVENPDFNIISQTDLLSTLSQVTRTFTIFLSSIAGISLLVGGIGIMNMMLTAVTERTREIGLRRAIGAKRREIVKQFLLEAVALTVSGGILGMAFGALISLLITRVVGISTAISFWAVSLALGISAAIGIIFGLYPAYRAANLNPIEALRYE